MWPTEVNNKNFRRRISCRCKCSLQVLGEKLRTLQALLANKVIMISFNILHQWEIPWGPTTRFKWRLMSRCYLSLAMNLVSFIETCSSILTTPFTEVRWRREMRTWKLGWAMILVQDKVWEDFEALRMMMRTSKSLGMVMEFSTGLMVLTTRVNGIWTKLKAKEHFGMRKEMSTEESSKMIWRTDMESILTSTVPSTKESLKMTCKKGTVRKNGSMVPNMLVHTRMEWNTDMVSISGPTEASTKEIGIKIR